MTGKKQKVLFLGHEPDPNMSETVRKKFKAVGEFRIPDSDIPTDIVVVIWDVQKISPANKAKLGKVKKFVEAGGKLVVMNQKSWPLKKLADIEIGWPEFKHMNPATGSRAHFYKGAEKHPMFKNIHPEYLWRFNGLPGTVADAPIIGGADLKKAKKLLWVSNEKFPVAISLPVGKGEIIFSQLRSSGNPEGAPKTFDPAAYRVMMNLLSR